MIKDVAVELEWQIIFKNSNAIVAQTHPSLFSGSWGERITILFCENELLVNSICDPRKKHSMVSFGRNAKNENRLLEEIEKLNRKFNNDQTKSKYPA